MSFPFPENTVQMPFKANRLNSSGSTFRFACIFAVTLATACLLLPVSASRAQTPISHIFASNYNENKIRQFTSDGAGNSVFINSGLNGPSGITFDSSGNFYVANNLTNTIKAYTSSGVLLSSTSEANFSSPAGMAIDSAGNLYVANSGISNIMKFTPNFAGATVFASTGLSIPVGLAFDSLGNLYASNLGTNTIEKFSQTGVDLGVFASTGLNGPYGLAFDALDNLYVANLNNSTVVKFTNGVGSVFANNSHLSLPHGLAFDSGNLFVSNGGNGSTIGASIAKFTQAGFDSVTVTDGVNGAVLNGANFLAIAPDQNPPPVSNGISGIVLPDTSKASIISLASAFTSSQPLTYSITGNTNPGLFVFAGIDSTSNLLVLNYTAGVRGSSQITITASDPGGHTAAATFLVTADLVATISDWQAGVYGSSAVSAAGDLSKYAFALSVSGAKGPAMRMQKGSPVFSHLKPKYASDLGYSYQISQDLVHWVPAVQGVHYFPYAIDNHNGTISENLVLLTKWNSAFVRANAQLKTPATATTPITTFPAIGNVTVLDTATPTTLQLPAPQSIKYSITGNTNPNLFNSVSIDSTNGLLNLNYKSGTSGASTLTVTGRDTNGTIVSTTSFTATVGRIQTLSDWLSFYSGSVPAATTQQLMNYGLAINPTSGATSGVLPSLTRQNGSLVFSHLRPKFATDLSYQYQISSDLVHWIPAVNGVHFFDFSQDHDDGTRLVNLLLLVDWPRAFVKAGGTLVAP